jgi:hypothetical protein
MTAHSGLNGATRGGLLEQDLRSRLARGRVVVIVGAGVAVSATRGNAVASWVGLLENGISRCEQRFLTLPDDWGERLRVDLKSGDVDRLVAVADEVAQAFGAPSAGEYRRWLRETVGALEPLYPDVISALRDLQVPIATTNYDSLVEKVTGLKPVTWREDAKVDRLLQGDEPAVLHLHGHWDDPQSVVLGIHAYEDVLGDTHAQFVQRAVAAYNSLLFVGCGEGLTDPNFAALRRWLAEVFSAGEYRHFRLSLESEARALATEHADEQIVVVAYGERHRDLAAFVRSLGEAVPRERRPDHERPVAWPRRHPWIAASGAVLIGLATIFLAVLFWKGNADGAVSTAIPVGATVSPGKPLSGAGDIGRAGELDVYSFSGNGKTITLVNREPPGGECPGGRLYWRLTHRASGEDIFDNSMVGCSAPIDEGGYTLRGGEYTLTVYGVNGATGAYAFTLGARG